MNNNIIGPEDYMEPACPLCDEPFGAEPKVKPVPEQRIIQKMDEYMSRRDYAGAEKHLLYWLEEAKLGRDERGQLMLRNELVGHYRKTGEKEKAFEQIGLALDLIKQMDYDGSITSGTTYVNCATACNAFGDNERSLELFEKARAVYEAAEHTNHELLGGLYNNMALTCAALNRYDEAFGLYEKAIEQMKEVPGGELETAITYLNMADTLEKQNGLEESESRIFDLLDQAQELLENKPEEAADGYYAFVLEKCAPAFSYYGYFLAADEMLRKSKEIYERN